MKKHKTTEAWHAYQQDICAQPGCKFKGKPAQQGVCHSDKGEVAEFEVLARHEAQIAAEMKAMRKREGKNYLATLESHYQAAMLNWTFTLDECVRLRRDIALLKAKRKP